jgi:hypothetical protein
VLPKNWGEPHPGPREFPFIDDGLMVQERYTSLSPETSKQLERLFNIAREAGADRVYIDRPYIDFDYRSDMAHFYSRAFRPPSYETERLLFAAGERLLGASVIRPLPQPVGRTILEPPAIAAPYVCCTTIMPVHAFGYTWPVKGFPFTSQDGEYAVCAHAAIWAIARYHHLKFGTDRHTTSGIIEAAGLQERPDRTARSDGLYGSDIARAFRGIGLPVMQYAVDKIKAPETVDTVICRYLDSALPVGVLMKEHMVVVIGYGVRDDGKHFYIVSDDQDSAYKTVESAPGAWEVLIVPQPGRIHVNGESAQSRAEQAFEDRVRADHGPGDLFKLWSEGKIKVRTYATPSPEYVGGLLDRGVPVSIRNHHLYAPKGNWVWVTEFQDTAQPSERRVLGEIAVDATSLQLDPSPIIGNIDGWAYVWPEQISEPNVARPEPSGARYMSALADRTERPTPPQVPAFKPLGGREAAG